MACRLTPLVLCVLCLFLLQLPGSLEEEKEERCAEGNGACAEQQSPVLKLDDSNFNSELEEKDLAVVAFHAPWCHHCHTYLTDVFTPAAEELVGDGVTMATVDIEEAREVQSKFVIREVPAVRLFRHGMMFPYQGPPQHMGIPGLVKYLRDEKVKPGLEENPVITLTNDNFDEIVPSTELILVEFYTDMCVPCQQLEPHFTAAARHLLHNDPPVLLGRVQIPDQIEVAKRFPLEGYPLLIMFRYGRQYNYTGPKDAQGIVEYMKQQAGPSSILLEQAEDVKKFIQRREVSVVGYFTKHTDPTLVQEFLESGNLVRTDMTLRHTLEETVAAKMKQSSETIVVYHPTHLVTEFEKGFSVIHSPPANATELRQLYLEHARPLVGEMTQQNYVTLYHHRPLLLAYYEVDWSRDGFKATQYWHHLIASIAKDFLHNDIIFAVANEEDYPNDLRSVGLSDWGEEVAVALFAPGPLKYPMTEELSHNSLTHFLQAYLDGDLESHFSSEPPPKPVKGALIRKVVGSTFKAEVQTPQRNVLVLLCVPDLPDCRRARDHLSKLASQFKGVRDLVLAEMNVALNDPPNGTRVDSLPAFFFSPKGSEEILPVTPQPQDDADLAFFLKWKQNIKPLAGSKGKKKRKGGGGRDEL